MATSQRYQVIRMFGGFYILDTLTDEYYGYLFATSQGAEMMRKTESFAWAPGWHTYDELKARRAAG